MKSSERITQIVRDLAREEAKHRGSYMGWEGLEELTNAIVVNEGVDLLPIAIMKFLDEVIEET